MIRLSDTIGTRIEDDIGIIIADNPPVNALSHAVREGLVQAVDLLKGNGQVRAIVIVCAGRTFFAGADISEFGKPRKEPFLVDVVGHIEASPKPVIAAIHGTALGGGFEVALGCHFRVAVPSARVGLPEIKLGLFAGAGGTQRLPRLIGPEAALEHVLAGKPIAAFEALNLGILDTVDEGEPLDLGLSFARRVLDERLSAVPVRDRTE